MVNAKATSAHRARGQSLQSLTTVAANDHCSKGGKKGGKEVGGGFAIQCIFLPGAHFSQLHLKWHKEGFEFHRAMIWTGAEPGYHPPHDCKTHQSWLEQTPAYYLPPRLPPLLARAIAFRGKIKNHVAAMPVGRLDGTVPLRTSRRTTGGEFT